MGSSNGALYTSSLTGCTQGRGLGQAGRALSSPSFGVCHNRGASLLPPTFSAARKPGRTHVLIPGAATGCKLGLFHAAASCPPWHGVMIPVAFPSPCGFSGSKAPRQAETCSSCLSDPQVKDEDKSLAVKRPGKEDGAVSVTGHGLSGAVLGMGFALGGDRPRTRAWGHHGRSWAQHPPPHPPWSLGSAGGRSRAACGGWWVFSAGILGRQRAAISPPPSPWGLSLPCTPQQDGGSVPTPRLQCRLLRCPPKLLAEEILRLALRVAEGLPVP